jgi:small subunit ribosomal protein S2
MERYIFGERNGVHIIDLHQTVQKLSVAYDFVRDLTTQGKTVLFVGTKRQAQEIVGERARACGAFYVSHRWCGGMLTNFSTIRKGIEKLKKLEAAREDGTHERLPKKEVFQLEKERERLEQSLGGIKEMSALPAAIFIVDIIRENTAVLEARRLGIPVVAMVDTNCDPDQVDYVIPGNDDALRAIRLVTDRMASAVLEGRGLYEKRDRRPASPTSSTGTSAARTDAPASPVEPTPSGIKWD